MSLISDNHDVNTKDTIESKVNMVRSVWKKKVIKKKVSKG